MCRWWILHTDIAITNIANSTSTGIGLTVPVLMTRCNQTVAVSGTTGVVGLGYLNGTDFVLIHAAIPTLMQHIS